MHVRFPGGHHVGSHGLHRLLCVHGRGVHRLLHVGCIDWWREGVTDRGVLRLGGEPGVRPDRQRLLGRRNALGIGGGQSGIRQRLFGLFRRPCRRLPGERTGLRITGLRSGELPRSGREVLCGLLCLLHVEVFRAQGRGAGVPHGRRRRVGRSAVRERTDHSPGRIGHGRAEVQGPPGRRDLCHRLHRRRGLLGSERLFLLDGLLGSEGLLRHRLFGRRPVITAQDRDAGHRSLRISGGLQIRRIVLIGGVVRRIAHLLRIDGFLVVRRGHLVAHRLVTPGPLGARHQQLVLLARDDGAVVVERIAGLLGADGTGSSRVVRPLLLPACVLRQSLARDLAGVGHAYPSPIGSAPSRRPSDVPGHGRGDRPHRENECPRRMARRASAASQYAFPSPGGFKAFDRMRLRAIQAVRRAASLPSDGQRAGHGADLTCCAALGARTGERRHHGRVRPTHPRPTCPIPQTAGARIPRSSRRWRGLVPRPRLRPG